MTEYTAELLHKEFDGGYVRVEINTEDPLEAYVRSLPWWGNSKRRIEVRPLADKVLVVAVVDEMLREWTAYVYSVPGESHSIEWERVAESGVKMDKMLASVMFPQIAAERLWRP